MKSYFETIFRHEYWANQQVINAVLTIENPPERLLPIASHLIAAQRTWLDRLLDTSPTVKVWEVFESSHLLELLVMNNQDTMKIINSCDDFDQLVNYSNSKGEKFSNTVQDILTQLSQHAAYHRGQIIILMKPFVGKLPVTDYIFYIRQ